MAARTWYVTSAIPYVNADPHLGHALEFVQTDALARWLRLRGDDVRSLWGTDDNAAKNADAARDAGMATEDFVDLYAARFEALRDVLGLAFDDFIRTSRDPRHRPGVERLWRACAEAGDLYRGRYEGLYCAGCEQFYEPGELSGGRCPEHGTRPQPVAEDNWFFRLSRHARPVLEAIESGALRIVPEHRRNEVVAFLSGEVRDISVSRPAERSGGWGIAVPDDPGQVIYVWFDALANYISALGYGHDGEDYGRWWTGADRRAHVIGKGILRFHAVYWPAFLLSAGEPLPTDICVHEYLTVDGAKISKSAGAALDPGDLASRYGADAVRWWLLRDVNAAGDTDFRVERLIERHDHDLANGLGNLVSRVLGLARRSGGSLNSRGDESAPLAGPAEGAERIFQQIDSAAERLDFRAAASALWELVDATNAHISTTRPWALSEPRDGIGELDDVGVGKLDDVVADLLSTCRLVGRHLAPFLPGASRRILEACQPGSADSLREAPPLFPRLAPPRR